MSQKPKEDIRGQLSDIQKKLFGGSKDRQAHPIRQPDSSQPSRTPSSTDVAHNSPTLKSKSSSLSLGKLSNSSRSNVPPPPAPVLGPESKGHDMGFVVGLSENLLSECRRLTAENKKYKSKLRDSYEEVAKFKNQVVTLTNSRSFAANTEEQLKDKNWELETNISALKEQLEKVNAANDKLIKSNNESTLRITSIQKENDDLVLQTTSLRKDLLELQDTFANETNILNTRISALNDENDSLHLKLSSSTSNDQANQKPATEQDDDVAFHTTTDLDTSLDDPVDLDSILKVAADLPKEHQSSSDASDLNVETLKANLNHSYRIVAKLRSALLKLRFDNASPLSRPTPRSAKKHSKHKDLLPPPANRSTSYFSPAKKASKFVFLNDDDLDSTKESWPEDAKWEDYLEKDPSNTTPSKASKPGAIASSIENTPSVSAHSNVDSDSSELEDDAPMAPKQRALISELSNAAGQVTEQQVQEFAKEHRLVLVPQEEYSKLQYNDMESVSEERLIRVAEQKDFVLLRRLEHQNLLDEQQMRARLEQRGFVSLSTSEYESLAADSKSFSDPPLDYLKTKIRSSGLEPVDTEYLESLERSQTQMQNPSRAYLQVKCKEAHLMPVEVDEYNRLKATDSEHNTPSKEYLTEKANELGLIVASSQLYDELTENANNPSIDRLRSLCKSKEHHIFNNNEVFELQHPNIEHLQKLAAENKYVLISAEEHETLRSRAESPTSEAIEKAAKQQKLVVLSQEEYEQFKSTVENPSLEHIMSKASALDYSVIPTEELHQLNDTVSNPPIDFVKDKAVGHKVVPEATFKDLLEKAFSPSLSHVQESAEKHNLVTLGKKEYAELYKNSNDPTIERMEAKAQEKSLVLLKSSEFEDMKRKIDEPGLNVLENKASALGYSLIQSSELEDLREALAHPSAETVKNLAGAHGLVAVSETELEQLKAEPTLEELQIQASKKNHVLSSKKDFDELKRNSETPDIDLIKKHAATLSHELISIEELETLKAPLFETIEEHASTHDMALIQNKSLDDMKRRLDSPEVEELEKHAAKKQHKVVPVSTFENLQRLANSPSRSELEAQVSKLDCQIVPDDELKSLKSPSLDDLKTHASSQGHLLIPQNEYSGLKEEAENPSLELLSRKALSAGHCLLLNEKFEALKQLAENPSLESARASAQRFDHVILPKHEHEQLSKDSKNPTLETIKEHANSKGHVLLSNEDYAEVQRMAHDPSTAELESHAKKHAHLMISAEAYKQLEEPLKEVIIEKAEKAGLIALPREKWNHTLKLASAAPLEHLEKQASLHKMKLVSQEELERLSNEAHNPQKESIVKKALALGLTAIPSAELASIELRAKNPPISHIKEVAQKNGFIVLPADEHKALLDPSMDHIESLAKKNGGVVLPSEEHSRLEKLANEPPLDFLSQEAHKQEYEIISKKDLADLSKAAHEPTLQHLKEKASKTHHVLVSESELNKLMEPSVEDLQKAATKLDMVIIEKNNLEHLNSLAHSPSTEHLSSKATALNHSLITTQEYKKLQRLAHEPNEEELRQSAGRLGLDIIKTDELREMKANIDNPSLDSLKTAISSHGFVAIPSEELEAHLDDKEKIKGMKIIAPEEYSSLKSKIANPSLSYLQDHAKELGYAILELSKLEEFQHVFASPSVEFLTEKSESSGYKMLTQEEVNDLHAKIEKLTNPDEAFLTEKAKLAGFALLKLEDYQKLNSIQDDPSLEFLTQRAEAKQHKVVSQEVLEDLKQKIEHPQREYLEEKARELSCVLVVETELTSLSQALEKPSKQYLIQKAENIDMVLLDSQELKSLQSPLLEFLQSRAQELHQALIPQSDLDELRKNLKTPSSEYLTEKASLNQQRLVPEAEHDELLAYKNKDVKTLAEDAGFAVLTVEALKALRSLTEKPGVEFVRKHATAHGYSMVPLEELEELKRKSDEPTLEELEGRVKEHGYTLLSADELAQLKEPLEKKLNEQGLVGVEKGEYERLMLLIKEPTLASLREKAHKYDHVIITQDELKELQKPLSEKASLSGMVLVNESEHLSLQETIEDMSSKLRHPSMQYLQDSAASLGSVIVPQSDYEELKERDQTSIFDKASAMSLTAIPVADWEALKSSNASMQSMLDHSNKALADMLTLENAQKVASKEGFVLVKSETLDSLHKQAEETLEQKAEKSDKVLLTKDNHDEMMRALNSPTEEEVKETAQKLGLACIPNEEYEALRGHYDTPIEEKAKALGLATLPAMTLEDLMQKSHSPSLDEVMRNATKYNHVVVPEEELEDLKSRASRSLEEQVQGTNLILVNREEYDGVLVRANKPSIEQIRAFAEKSGMMVIPNEEMEEMKQKINEPIEEQAEKLGFSVIDKTKLEGLYEKLESPEREYLEAKCETMGMIMVSSAQQSDLCRQAELSVYEKAEQENLAVLPKDDLANLMERADKAVSVDEARQLLLSQGLVIVPEDVYNALTVRSEMADPEKQIKNLETQGFTVSRAEDKFQDASEEFRLNYDELNKSASRLDKVVVNKDEYEATVEKAQALENQDKLAEAGKALSLSVLPVGELVKMKQSAAEKDSIIHNLSQNDVSKVSEEAILQRARELGFILVGKPEYQHLQNKVEEYEKLKLALMTKEELQDKAKELQLLVIPEGEYHTLKRSSQALDDRTEVTAAAKKLKMICVPEKCFVATTLNKEPEPEKVTLVPTTYYNKLSKNDALSIEKVNDDVFQKYAEKRGYINRASVVTTSNTNLPQLGSESAVSNSPDLQKKNVNIPKSSSVASNLTTNNSLLDSITGMSIASNISFTDRSMIPVITQVLIGEYLFKYYRKLGPFSSISADRHERYFWVHPYSLTLYWSTSNPVLTNPADAKNKAVAILGVESVEDNNPIPVGLYHKSIIVRSLTKSVKFTCANRQRHNIWYNSLRYLVHRNINELNFGAKKSSKLAAADDVDNDEEMDELHDMDFDPGQRQALPRSSTILRSSSFKFRR